VIPFEAVRLVEDRKDERAGMVSWSLWRPPAGQKGALLLRRTVERVSVVLRRSGDGRAEEVGFGRWLSNPKVTASEILSHAGAALGERVWGLHVLAIQDTTELNFEAHRGRVRGLGAVGNGSDRGLFAHPTIAVDAGSGALLGLAGAQLWTRRRKARADYKALPIERKESYRWLKAGMEAKAVLAPARLVTIIADRESDIYEEWARLPDARCHLLTRASRDRALADGGRLFTIADEWPVCHRFALPLRAQPGKPARPAQMSLRFGVVTIKKPGLCRDRDAPDALTLRLVDVCEEKSGRHDPIHWRLLTTHAVESVADALRIVGWYQQRWHIEQVFRCMKSQGLNIEASQVANAKALFNLAAIATLAAVKIMQLVHARNGRVERPATDVVDRAHLPLLAAMQQRLEGKTTLQKNPHARNSLAWLSWIIARLGGWNGYPSEKPPGPLTMRHGWQRFETLAEGWMIATGPQDVCTP
jgi:hypothetical protein